MSALEIRARDILEPMFGGERIGLDIGACATLSVWAVKTAMILERLETNGEVQYTLEECVRLRRFSLVPAWSRIWLAAAVDGAWLFSVKSRQLDATVDPRAASQVTTLAFGTVVIQIYTLRLCSALPDGVTVTTDVRRGPWDDATVQLWPAAANTSSWPPRVALSGLAGLDAFAERFHTSNFEPRNLMTVVI